MCRGPGCGAIVRPLPSGAGDYTGKGVTDKFADHLLRGYDVIDCGTIIHGGSCSCHRAVGAFSRGWKIANCSPFPSQPAPTLTSLTAPVPKPKAPSPSIRPIPIE